MNRTEKNRREMTFRDVCLALVRQRRKAAAFFLAAMAVTILVTLLTPKAYLSQSKLFVRLGRENAMLDSTATLGKTPVVALPMSRESEINSVAEMIATRAVFEQVVDELGPATILDRDVEPATAAESTWVDTVSRPVRNLASGAVASLRSVVSGPDLTSREKAIEKLEKRLTVEPAYKSNVLDVSFEASSPELAQRVVGSLVETYLEEHARLNRTQGTHDFFSKHTERLQGNLATLEEELRQLKSTTGIADIQQQRTQIVSRLGRLEDELLAAQALRTEAEAKVETLRSKLAELPKEQVLETASGIGNQGTDMIRHRYFDLQVTEKAAAARYTASHPRLVMLREELAEAGQILAEQEQTRTQMKTAPDKTYEQARLALAAEEPNLAALKAKSKALTSQLVDVRGALETLNADDIRIAQLQRTIDQCEADYRKYAANVEQARIDEAMQADQMSNISVVQPASLQCRAIRPRKAMNLALGMLIAACGAFGIALLADYLEGGFRTQKEIEPGIEVPTLASIPRIGRKSAKVGGRT